MKFLKLAAFGLAILLIALSSSFVFLLGAKEADSDQKTDFVVKTGETRSAVAQRLASQNLIRSSFAFFLYSKIIRGKVLPGTYDFSPALSASTIAEMLNSGRVKKLKITLIEGWRSSQITEYLTKEKNLLQLADFTAKGERYEGYLFPDTYEIKVDITDEELIALLRENFERRVAQLKVTAETVILASIVEREAKSDEERPQIAAVYTNRLKIGMKLEADPTVQYAKGSWASPTVSDYKNVISPYNTYLNDGLPPGPIANPGLASLKAALSPASHDYYYFFHAKGQTYFSKTLEEHRAKVRQYF